MTKNHIVYLEQIDLIMWSAPLWHITPLWKKYFTFGKFKSPL